MGIMLAVIMNVTPSVGFTLCLFFVMALIAGCAPPDRARLAWTSCPSSRAA